RQTPRYNHDRGCRADRSTDPRPHAAHAATYWRFWLRPVDQSSSGARRQSAWFALSLRSHSDIDGLRPHDLEQPLDDGQRGHPFSLRIEISQDTMAQDRGSQRPYIVDRSGKASVHDSTRLGTQNEILGSTRASPPVDPFFDKRGRFGMIG